MNENKIEDGGAVAPLTQGEREELERLRAENETFRQALKPRRVDFVTGEDDTLIGAGINVFAVKLLVESIERRRKELTGKALILPVRDHTGAIGYVILCPDLPENFPSAVLPVEKQLRRRLEEAKERARVAASNAQQAGDRDLYKLMAKEMGTWANALAILDEEKGVGERTQEKSR